MKKKKKKTCFNQVRPTEAVTVVTESELEVLRVKQDGVSFGPKV